MTTPTAEVGSYRVTWVSPGDRSLPHTHTVEATGVFVDTPNGFTMLNGADDAPVFLVNNAFLVSIERIAEKG